jgi:hypothetical protein
VPIKTTPRKALPPMTDEMPIRCTVIFDVSADDLHNAMECVIDAARSYAAPRQAFAENIPTILEFTT